MRIVKVGVLAPTNKGIPLGVQGENRATKVEFDTRPWFREYPSGTVSAVARRDGDPAPYPLTLDVEDGTAVWQVSDTDTAKAGEGAVELTMTSAGARVRSLTFKTLVTASLTDAPVDDDAWYGWLDKAVVKVDETVQSAQRKMGEVDLEWAALKADVTEKVDECGEVAAQAASDAHHAKVDAQATAKALESAEGSVAKAEAAANRAVDAALAADDSAVEASRSALSAWESAESAAGSATNAARSAREAATSASNAADAASAASGSASVAAQSATDASNAKVAAQTAKDEAEAAKNEAATSAGNAATSAEAAAQSASDAAASVGETLSEVKKYTDANTSNALVNTVSGKLLHVEDAWPGKPLGLKIDGAYKQDGTTSPENPVPIVVVENPVLKVTGRNFIDPDKMKHTGTYYANLNGELRIISGDGRSWSTIPEYGVLPAGKYTIDGDSCEIRKASDDTTIAYTNAGKISFTLQVATTIKIKIGFGHPDNQYPYVSNCFIAMVNSGSVTYAPYTSQSIPITLPAEHPYLAKLPDGTADTIEVDKDGNVNLVERVARSIIPDKPDRWGKGYMWHSFPKDGEMNTGSVGVLCDKLKYSKASDIYKGVAIGISIGDIFTSNAVSTCVFIGDNDIANIIGSTIYYKLATTVTYPLGKLDIPSLPDSISNVWTDAELTTNMSMTYKRDINIAFDNLVQAVVAAAAGE